MSTKIMIQNALELVEDAQYTAEAVSNLISSIDRREKHRNHPYYMLEDSKGYLTRYPQEECNIPREWMEEYIASGGGCDAMGHYGVSPTWKDATKYAPQVMALVYEDPKLQFSGDYFQEAWDWGLRPRTLVEGLRAAKGLRRFNYLLNLGIRPISPLSLGYMTKQKFITYVMKRTKLSRLGIKMSLHYSQANQCDYLHMHICGETFSVAEKNHSAGWVVTLPSSNTLYNSVRGYTNRNCGEGREWYRNPYYTVGSVRSAAVCQRLEVGYNLPNTCRTSVGYVGEASDGLFLFGKWDGSRTPMSQYSLKRLGSGLYTARIGGIVFVWEKGNFNSSHVEGKDLRSAVQVILKRNRISSLILKLNDVRNDVVGTAGFCLAGTKGFLRNRMRFLFNLIQEYTSWAEIPAEIMELEFHLADASIFDGYRNPTTY